MPEDVKKGRPIVSLTQPAGHSLDGAGRRPCRNQAVMPAHPT
jgi:hypothetical protein